MYVVKKVFSQMARTYIYWSDDRFTKSKQFVGYE